MATFPQIEFKPKDLLSLPLLPLLKKGNDDINNNNIYIIMPLGQNILHKAPKSN